MKFLKLLVSLTGFCLIAYIVVFSFDSSCACVPADVEFGMYLGIPPKNMDDQRVLKGFAAKYPAGSSLKMEELLTLGESRENWSSGSVIGFDYWLESSMIAKRGYRVSFMICEDGKVEKVDVKPINSWFGRKTTG